MATLARALSQPLRRMSQPIQVIVSMRRAPAPRLFFLAYGFLPILCLSLALQGLVPLHYMAMFVLIPATAGALVLGRIEPTFGKLALAGLMSGMVAVAMYDLAKWPALAVDPIAMPPAMVSELLGLTKRERELITRASNPEWTADDTLRRFLDKTGLKTEPVGHSELDARQRDLTRAADEENIRHECLPFGGEIRRPV